VVCVVGSGDQRRPRAAQLKTTITTARTKNAGTLNCDGIAFWTPFGRNSGEVYWRKATNERSHQPWSERIIMKYPHSILSVAQRELLPATLGRGRLSSSWYKRTMSVVAQQHMPSSNGSNVMYNGHVIIFVVGHPWSSNRKRRGRFSAVQRPTRRDFLCLLASTISLCLGG